MLCTGNVTTKESVDFLRNLAGDVQIGNDLSYKCINYIIQSLPTELPNKLVRFDPPIHWSAGNGARILDQNK